MLGVLPHHPTFSTCTLYSTNFIILCGHRCYCCCQVVAEKLLETARAQLERLDVVHADMASKVGLVRGYVQ